MEKIKIKFWYSSDGTPNINKECIDELQTNYLRLDNLKEVRKYIIKSLNCLYKSFKEDGKEITEGVLELKIQDKKDNDELTSMRYVDARTLR